MDEGGEGESASFDLRGLRERGWGKSGNVDGGIAEPGEGVRWRSVVEVGLVGSKCEGVLGDFALGGGGIGGKPPLPSPLRIDLVSLSRCWARSCWPRETSVRARVSISEVRSSILR